MIAKRPKSSRKTGNQPNLTKKQLELMELAYRYRFITSSSLATFSRQSQTVSAHRRLEALVSLGYLAKRYDSSYRLPNRPAEYYLTFTSIPLLRIRLPNANDRELKQIYIRPKASARFIDRSLAIFATYLELRRLYGPRLNFATNPQLNTEQFDFLPDPLPDALITLDTKTSRERHLFVDYFDDSVSIGTHGRRVLEYMEYKDDGGWDGTELVFPTVLIVCQSDGLLKRASKRVRWLEGQEDSAINFRLIDLASLKRLDNNYKKSWTEPIVPTMSTL